MPFSEEHFHHLVMEEACKVQFVALFLHVNIRKLFLIFLFLCARPLKTRDCVVRLLNFSMGSF